MIDTVLLMEARQRAMDAGRELFAVRDGDIERGHPCAWTCFRIVEGPRHAEALLSRKSRRRALEAGWEYMQRLANPVRCCGKEISPFDPPICPRCGDDHR